jgi:signal transduction histidine kinase
MIAAVLVPVGLALVIVQQAVFTNLLDTQFMYKVEQLRDLVPPADRTGDIPDRGADVETGTPGAPDAGEVRGKEPVTAVSGPDIEAIDAAARRVKTMATAWTVASTGVFAAVAVLAAWLLAGRALARVRQVTGFVRDISPETLGSRMALGGPDGEVTDLAATFDGLLSRLDAAFTARRRFVSNASHELRTPLATNRLGIQMAIARLERGGDPAAPLGTALEANRTAERVLSSLLALALASETRPDRPTQVADLSEIVSDALARATDDMRSERLILESDLTQAVASASPDLARIAVENLIDNAVKYSPPGGRVSVNLRTCNEIAELSVTNATIQLIDQDTANLLAEPFYRLEGPVRQAPKPGGLGLGLALVDSIAQRFGGSLTIEAQQSGELTIRLRLRCADA